MKHQKGKKVNTFFSAPSWRRRWTKPWQSGSLWLEESPKGPQAPSAKVLQYLKKHWLRRPGNSPMGQSTNHPNTVKGLSYDWDNDTSNRSGGATRDKEGKYLTFALAREEYGLEILKVREIIKYINVTAIPQTPPHVKGVVNLRGQVIPVVDLRAKFGMETAEVTDETCIIVVEIAQTGRTFNTGIIVDRVQEVLDIAGQDIEEAPQFDASVNTDFILGMGKIGGKVKILLHIDMVLAADNLASLS
jgi:purine-binding chemotaxis protein CheW